MDSVMNYVFRDALRDYIAEKSISVTEFDSRLNHMLAYYKDETDSLLYNLIDSHDTERFLYLCREDKTLLKLAVAFQILFPGSPAIYYGDEVGMTGDNDPDCRRCMEWGENADKDVKNWYQKMIQLRKNYSCIQSGSFRTVIADETTDTYGFVRKDETGSCYVILHRGTKNCKIECPVLERGVFAEVLSGELLREEDIGEAEFLNEDITEYKGKITLQMEPYSVKVIMSSSNSGKKQ